MAKKRSLDKNKKDIIGKGLNENLNLFLKHINAIRDTFLMEISLILPHSKEVIKEFCNFYDNKIKEIDGSLVVEVNDYKKFKQLEENASTAYLALEIISNSLFVSLISRYDAFFSNCLKEVFKIKPDILNSIDKTICFSDIVNKESLEDIKNDVIEEEIQCLLRGDHKSQLAYLEKKLKITIKDLPLIEKNFVEITERRNLIVHCEGIVSKQYMKVCSPIDIKRGDKLTIKPDYLISSHQCLYELSVKLTHTLWRKLLNSELEQADNELNSLCFNLIEDESFALADNLLAFALENKNIFNEASRSVYIINAALSKYLQNDKQKAQDILNQKDWSASSDSYKLAHAILNDNYKKACEIMFKIGDKGEIEEFDYRSWPLFISIRKEKVFKETYKKIFNKDYSIIERPMGVTKALLQKKKKRLSPELETKLI
ncbi:MAG TPA: hypothetical protein PKN62_01175 [bacterium]|nr:hypothetical protein [bacterium]